MFSRKKLYTGIDIHGQDIHIATLQENGAKVRLIGLDSFRLKQPLIKDGRLQESTSLLQLFALLKKGLAKHVHYSLPTQHVMLRSIRDLPNLAVGDLDKIIQFEIGESIHLPFQHAVYDFNKIGVVQVETQADSLSFEVEESHQKEECSHVMLVASSHELAEDIVTIAKKAKQKLGSIEIRATALQRVLTTLDQDKSANSTMVIDIREQFVDVHIMHEGLPLFTRSLLISKEDYLALHKGMELKEQQSSWEQAATASIGQRGRVSDRQSASTLAATSLAEVISSQREWDQRQYISDLINEIERAQNFYRFTLNQGQEIERYVVTGDYNELVIQELTRYFEQKVETIDFTSLVGARVKNVQLVDVCSTAIGLALRMKEKRQPKT